MRPLLPPIRAARKLARRSHRRRGFTLIELLIVIAIILILVGLVIRVSGTVIANGRTAATKQRIKVVQDALTQKLDAFTRYFNVPQNLTNQKEYVDALTEAGGNEELAAILAKKKLLRRFFPQNLTEYPDLRSSMTDSAKHIDATESAEILYFILTKGTVLGEPPLVGGGLDSSAIKDTDGDGLLEIVDAWNRPLRFYRWPTRLVKTDGNTVSTAHIGVLDRAAPTATTQLGTDQDDPLNKTSGLASFESNYHTQATYHNLLLVSAGVDGELGLYEPTDYTNFGYLAAPKSTAGTELADNFTNLNIVAGGN